VTYGEWKKERSLLSKTKRGVKLTEKCISGCNRLIKEVGDEQSQACLDEGETRRLL